MAQNKNALIRYKTIDKCLQNRYKEWTLDDLIEACSEALYEYEGRDINVSKRSVQLDIQMMRSDKLGYNAPIVVYNKKYYKYDDDNYSIMNIPLNENDMSILSETVEMLKQFKDFSLFSELGGIIKRLEDKVYSEKTNQPCIIHFDKNENLKGLQHLDIIYQAILKEVCLNVKYQSFTAKKPTHIVFYPYILKEFNNRWFMVGKRKNNRVILNFALDRIMEIDYNFVDEYIKEPFDGEKYYKDTIGVTVMNKKQLYECHLKVNKINAPYVLTKPIHQSQKLVEELEDGSVIISVYVHINYEFERIILGFGDSMEVIKPWTLKSRMKWRLKKAYLNYEKEKED
ncbi:WYL domain-containing protein [Flammeovirga yaeyamensis]|uniref:WYL domain-containing protein n=1 Tax=Flammeovirga yaeyamensis TaxID=367791 RepID=A0AAX1NDY2_9BACT|nr:WYL domain-containing protein [Flammeovirga yaeyamensis]MBB3696820.1 putative DNA-binding transcriptional regulator YafY [Flammeovirga yaeyamensis]NMF33485.1 WYL domain-containing protein [Flammeovirga yaeyamensis]QWG05241.1 WYL domain-containing protein [Flammeovirga yaeyamensis]